MTLVFSVFGHFAGGFFESAFLTIGIDIILRLAIVDHIFEIARIVRMCRNNTVEIRIIFFFFAIHQSILGNGTIFIVRVGIDFVFIGQAMPEFGLGQISQFAFGPFFVKRIFEYQEISQRAERRDCIDQFIDIIVVTLEHFVD